MEKLKKDNLIGVLSKLETSFAVSFTLKLNNFSDGFRSVLHLTTGENNEKYGDRIPGVWIYYKMLHVAFAINGNQNHYLFSKPLTLGEWTVFQIRQSVASGKTIFEVYVNFEKVYEVENLKPQEFKNVKVYAGDPWYEAQDGYIGNIVVFPLHAQTKNSLKNDAIKKKKFGPEF
ncbi:uncharacterized protein LOC136086642 [Hydra vulgaris]